MFLCAVARPRYDESTGRWFDSKIGISSFVETVPADRTSRNRPAGTIETKSVAVTKAVYREYVINKVLPAVRSKWPVSMRKMPIFLQHDNASAHGVFDEAFQAQCNVSAFACSFSLQITLQFEKEATNIDEMLRAVDEAFLEVDITTLENVFLTLQSVMISVLEVRGYNNYKMPHLGKAKQRRVGQLPVSLPVSRGLVAMCVEEIEEYDMQSQFESLTL
ncbi:hypothetical protein Ae201684P_022215 [Aphanomyces euteiches]|nr:hypothetical protein Ae201684P_022215 [Aphanomyces euteiches]